MTSTARRRYRCAGVVIETTLNLAAPESGDAPELPVLQLASAEAASARATCVAIADYGAFRLGRHEAGFYLSVRNVGAFLIDRHRIGFSLEADADQALAASMALGPALGLWLEISGRIVLHGAAVSRQGRAVGLVGDKGAGKSTLAMRLVERGWSFLSDDQLVLHEQEHGFTVLPTLPTLKLWPDSLDQAPDGFTDSGPVGVLATKRRVTLPESARASAPCALSAILLLARRSDESEVTACELTAPDAMVALLRQSALPRLVAGAGLSAQRLPALQRLVAQHPVCTLSFVDGAGQGGEVEQAILRCMER